jgi:hypothetical protein
VSEGRCECVYTHTHTHDFALTGVGDGGNTCVSGTDVIDFAPTGGYEREALLFVLATAFNVIDLVMHARAGMCVCVCSLSLSLSLSLSRARALSLSLSLARSLSLYLSSALSV